MYIDNLLMTFWDTFKILISKLQIFKYILVRVNTATYNAPKSTEIIALTSL